MPPTWGRGRRTPARRCAIATGCIEADLALLYNVSAEFAYSLDQRSLPDRARSAVFSSIPDAILVSGQITGEAAALSDLEAVKKALPDTPVLANTGVKHATVADVLKIADGCIVGSSLKVDGNTWNAVDPDRAAEFMRPCARGARRMTAHLRRDQGAAEDAALLT